MSSSSRGWMYNRLDNGFVRPEFIRGVEAFLEFASAQENLMDTDHKIRCPCCKCKNKRFLTCEEVGTHLFKKGFMSNYQSWVAHGESNINHLPRVHTETNTSPYTAFVMDAMGQGVPCQGVPHQGIPEQGVPHQDVPDQGEPHDDYNFEDLDYNQELPNLQASNFYSLLNDADELLYMGAKHSILSATSQLLNIKVEFNVSNTCHDRYMSVLKSMLPEGNKLPQNTYQSKKLMKALNLEYQVIDACVNDCVLYYKETKDLRECPICSYPRFKPKKIDQSRRLSDVPFKRLRYLPLTPRLQRLYMSRKTAKEMTWHARNTCPNEELVAHPSDSEAWKHFDNTYPEFAIEQRNVRIGICTDGFSPTAYSGRPYSVWPVLVVVYNLPPWMCMKPPFIFLSLVIPGPQSPGKELDVFLRPLIDELNDLWNHGVITFDADRKQNFTMRVAVMWTISDFPAYAMLSGWSTHGRLACPYCMENTKAFWLEASGKHSWFDCHRMHLPVDHEFRSQRNKFRKGVVERDCPAPTLTGNDIKNRLFEFEQIEFGKKSGNQRLPGFGREHNWIKQSIFWELPYWKTNLIRHNLDVMHIEKKNFDNIFNTVMDLPYKSKDTANARKDLKKYCDRRSLHLIDNDTKKPKASYTLTKENRKDICLWLMTLKFPDGYASNISQLVNMEDCSLYGMKSHDCHVFMQRLLPVAFRDNIPKSYWDALTEISHFFRDICVTMINTACMKKWEEDIVITICKLEKNFPPSFFDSMEHLTIHLAYEAKIGGPVQYRWMYPFERYMKSLKKK